MGKSILVALLLPLLLLGGCATEPPALYDAPPPAALLDGAVFGLDADDAPPDPDLLAVNDAMRAFLAEQVPAGAGDQRKVHAILRAIIGDGLQLQYDNLLTLTAAETFERRAGNCMSFTNLFLALAREAGVRANYQEVLVPPNWTAGESTWFYNLHVNVLVDYGGLEQVVDFNLRDYDNGYPRRLISDSAAESRHHSNVGVHWMTGGDPALAFLHFRRALELQPAAGHVWTNLGTLYRREGLEARAEAAFRRAIALDREPVAMSNLARLYREQGRPELAAWYEDQVAVFRGRNPYYLFHRAELAYEAGDYREARSLLRKALARHREDHRFHHLMAMSLLQLGDEAGGRRYLQSAAALAAEEDLARYNHKLELLAGG
jgi:Flp pilus assembly protein TadD